VNGNDPIEPKVEEKVSLRGYLDLILEPYLDLVMIAEN
jgi:hypothetical protein